MKQSAVARREESTKMKVELELGFLPQFLQSF